MPPGWPIDGSGKHVPPTTSTTTLASATPKQLVFVRNPYFREWSRAARPDRYTDKDVFRVPESVEAALKAVERIMDHVARTLRSLGYRVSVRFVPPDAPLEIAWRTRREVGVTLASWFANYPAASDFINNLLSCGKIRYSLVSLNLAEFCDRRIDAQIKRALQLEIADPAAANALWAMIDHEIVDQAPWVPLLNPQAFDFVSRRVGNYQYNQGDYALREQLWVR